MSKLESGGSRGLDIRLGADDFKLLQDLFDSVNNPEKLKPSDTKHIDFEFMIDMSKIGLSSELSGFFNVNVQFEYVDGIFSSLSILLKDAYGDKADNEVYRFVLDVQGLRLTCHTDNYKYATQIDLDEDYLRKLIFRILFNCIDSNDLNLNHDEILDFMKTTHSSYTESLRYSLVIPDNGDYMYQLGLPASLSSVGIALEYRFSGLQNFNHIRKPDEVYLLIGTKQIMPVFDSYNNNQGNIHRVSKSIVFEGSIAKNRVMTIEQFISLINIVGREDYVDAERIVAFNLENYLASSDNPEDIISSLLSAIKLILEK
jgi:hypothetical protein